MTSALDGPVVYPPWTGADHGDLVVQGTRGLIRTMGTVIAPWSSAGSSFAYDDGLGSTGTVEVLARGTSFSAAPEGSILRVDAANHLGLSLMRPVDLAKIGDEVRDLDAAHALPIGSLLGLNGLPTAVVSGDATTRTLLDLATGTAMEDLFDYLRLLYLAPRPPEPAPEPAPEPEPEPAPEPAP